MKVAFWLVTGAISLCASDGPVSGRQSQTPDFRPRSAVPTHADFSKYGYLYRHGEREVYQRTPNGIAVLGKLDGNGTFLPYEAGRQPHATTYNGMNTVAINDKKLYSGIQPLNQ